MLLPVSEEWGNVPYSCCCKHYLMNKTGKEPGGMQRKRPSRFSCLPKPERWKGSLTQCCSSSFDQYCNPWTGKMGWTRRLGHTGCCCASHSHSHYGNNKSWVHCCTHSLDFAHFSAMFLFPSARVGGSLLEGMTLWIRLIQRQSAWLVRGAQTVHRRCERPDGTRISSLREHWRTCISFGNKTGAEIQKENCIVIFFSFFWFASFLQSLLSE